MSSPAGHTDQPKAKRNTAASSTPLSPERAEGVEACQMALAECARLMMQFSHVSLEDLLKKTRGKQEFALPRQLLFAGLVMQLGFAKEIVGLAVGRDPSTIDHACRVVIALQGGMSPLDLIEAFGEDAVRDYLGGSELQCIYEVSGNKTKVIAIVSGGEVVDKFIDRAERLVDAMFAAFELVAVYGPAYRRDAEQNKTAHVQRHGEGR